MRKTRQKMIAALYLLLVLPYALEAEGQSKGMTWKFIATNAPTGTVKVGCAASCDAYKGDTPCNKALPLLCIRKAGSGFPLAMPPSIDNSSRYYQRTGGVIGTTDIVPPKTLAAANAVCAKTFGAD